MPRTLDLSMARSLLASRDQLLSRRWTDRQISTGVTGGDLVRVRRGWYVEGDAWRGLWSEGQHLLKVLAAHLNADGEGPVFSGESAAVLWGLPLYRHRPAVVHALLDGTRHGRTRAGILWHPRSEIDLHDIVTVDGIRCTSMDRTVIDAARTLPVAAAVSLADAALRRVATREHEQDAELAADWRERLGSRLGESRARGVRVARRVIAFADGRAQLPGESVSRLHLARLGFRNLGLQESVVGSRGSRYWLDFAFRGARVFGEFDGEGKYLDPDLLQSRSTQEVLLEEKRREDDIRGVTGWRLIRWGNEHIRSSGMLGARLSAFGVRPPG